MQHIELKTLSDTDSFAKKIAATIKGGETIALLGELGAGKTTFARYLILHLGGPEEVTSPTFVLSTEYKIKNGLTLEHWDLYRLAAAPQELKEESSNVRLIEWCDRDSELLASADLWIQFKLSGEVREVWVDS